MSDYFDDVVLMECRPNTLAHWDVVQQRWIEGPERLTKEKAAYHSGWEDGRRGWMCWCNDAHYLEGYADGMVGEPAKW